MHFIDMLDIPVLSITFTVSFSEIMIMQGNVYDQKFMFGTLELWVLV